MATSTRSKKSANMPKTLDERRLAYRGENKSERNDTRSKSAWITLSFANIDMEPLSVNITQHLTGKIFYEIVEEECKQLIDHITIYNSQEKKSIDDDDKIYSLLKEFMTRHGESSVTTEIPLFEAIVIEPLEDPTSAGSSGSSDSISGSESFRRGSRSPTIAITENLAPSLKTAIVFDFDCTLTKRHWYLFNNNIDSFYRLYTRKGVPDVVRLDISLDELKDIKMQYLDNPADEIIEKVIDLIWGSKERVSLLKRFLVDLRDNYSIKMFISSRGLVDQIEQGLDLIDIRDFFDNYQGTSSPQRLKHKLDSVSDVCSNPRDKETFILDCLFGDDYYNVIYIDDDHTENRTITRQFSTLKSKEPRLNYSFVNSLTKDIGGGISKIQIDQIYEILDDLS